MSWRLKYWVNILLLAISGTLSLPFSCEHHQVPQPIAFCIPNPVVSSCYWSRPRPIEGFTELTWPAHRIFHPRINRSMAATHLPAARLAIRIHPGRSEITKAETLNWKRFIYDFLSVSSLNWSLLPYHKRPLSHPATWHNMRRCKNRLSSGDN